MTHAPARLTAAFRLSMFLFAAAPPGPRGFEIVPASARAPGSGPPGDGPSGDGLSGGGPMR